MRLLVLSVLLAVTLSVTAAPAPLPRRDRGEKETLDGEWKMIEDKSRGGGGGGGPPGRQPENFTMVIRGREMKILVQEGGMKMEAEGELTLGTGAYPRTIDMRLRRARVNGQVMQDQAQTSLGLYQLEGNRLTIGMGNGDRKRPASLDDKTSEVLVFTRTGR